MMEVSPISTPLWLPAAVLLVLAARALVRAIARHPPYPPGPRALPIIGNALDLPRKHVGREFQELSAKYGDVVYLNVLGQPMVLLGSMSPVVDLLEKRSANYSDRPPSVMGKLTGWDWAPILMDYTPRWRHHRRIFHKFFEQRSTEYHEVQLREARKLLANLIRSPEKWIEHLDLAIGATILRATYGIQVDDHSRGYFETVKKATDIFAEAFVPGRYPVELFPSLRHLPPWFPGGGFKTTAAKWRKDVLAMRDVPFETVVKSTESGNAPPCIVSKMLDEVAQLSSAAEETLEACRNVAGNIYVGAAETANTTLQAFVLLMALNPDVQARAQAELDAVVGQGQLPDFADRARLPYMNALVLELLRWHVVPLGFPHRTAADDIYNGWLIPRGALVVTNVWAISRDPRDYPDPERFWPERFLKDGKLNPAVRDPNTYAFGFGRRVCPGRHFGDENVFILAASMLHAFTIGPPVDERGCVLPLEANISRNTITARVQPFRCTIRPRSCELAALARAGAEEGQA